MFGVTQPLVYKLTVLARRHQHILQVGRMCGNYVSLVAITQMKVNEIVLHRAGFSSLLLASCPPLLLGAGDKSVVVLGSTRGKQPAGCQNLFNLSLLPQSHLRFLWLAKGASEAARGQRDGSFVRSAAPAVL